MGQNSKFVLNVGATHLALQLALLIPSASELRQIQSL